MSFADELRNNYRFENEIEHENEIEYDSELDRNQRRINSLELLKDYVIKQVKSEATNATMSSERSLVLVPEYHFTGVWGTMSKEIGCLNYKYDELHYHENGYSGKLSFFVHHDDFDYFSDLVYKELRACGFDNIAVDFAPHYEKDYNRLFKGKLKYWSLQIKISW